MAKKRYAAVHATTHAFARQSSALIFLSLLTVAATKKLNLPKR